MAMSKFLRVPEAEEFSELVNLYEKTYSNLDSTYMKALQDFETKELSRFSENDTESILYPYLLKWGNMKRVLGYRGCKRIGEKLREMGLQLKKWRQESLSTVDLERMSNQVADIYDGIMNASWKSNKGRSKRVGPTAASKVLHLVAPNLFIIWDRAIRNNYGFKESGEEYFRFLLDMQNWMEKLGKSIDTLQNRYEKSSTKILDEYNWMESNKKPDSAKKTNDKQSTNVFKAKESKEREPEGQVGYVLVRNHLLCPYSDCICHYRSKDLRIQVLVNHVNGEREVSLKETVTGEKGRTNLPKKFTYEVYIELKCPYCQRPVEVVIDETHNGRNINLRLPQIT